MTPNASPDSSARRDAALRRLRRVNRALAAGALGLTLLLASTAAHAFPGHKRPARRSAAIIRSAPANERTRPVGPPATSAQRRQRHHRSHRPVSRPAATTPTSTTAPAPLSPPASAPQPAPAPSPAAPQPVASGGS
jgi:hypothetical protein